jgi:hypothetical protein
LHKCSTIDANKNSNGCKAGSKFTLANFSWINWKNLRITRTKKNSNQKMNRFCWNLQKLRKNLKCNWRINSKKRKNHQKKINQHLQNPTILKKKIVKKR